MRRHWLNAILLHVGLVRPPPLQPPIIPETKRQELEHQERRLTEASANHAKISDAAAFSFFKAEQRSSSVGVTVRPAVEKLKGNTDGS